LCGVEQVFDFVFEVADDDRDLLAVLVHFVVLVEEVMEQGGFGEDLNLEVFDFTVVSRFLLEVVLVVLEVGVEPCTGDLDLAADVVKSLQVLEITTDWLEVAV